MASGFAREWESRREEEMKGREEEGDRESCRGLLVEVTSHVRGYVRGCRWKWGQDRGQEAEGSLSTL